ncbi:MAG TPA: Holliday junction resolvase RuvX [Dehalococcoidia bacterium]|nr:Holliday junction resolvase RuvX [Dehalococcoidia bacterium]
MAAGERLLGIDVGERRIGVAVSEGTIAVPLTIIEHKNRATDIGRVIEIAERESVAAIVVGLPVSLSGEEHEQARLTRRFGEQLAEQAAVPVVYHDERYSTADARYAIESTQPAKPDRRARPSRKRVAHVDDRAAAVILQSYIDARERGA